MGKNRLFDAMGNELYVSDKVLVSRWAQKNCRASLRNDEISKIEFKNQVAYIYLKSDKEHEKFIGRTYIIAWKEVGTNTFMTNKIVKKREDINNVHILDANGNELHVGDSVAVTKPGNNSRSDIGIYAVTNITTGHRHVDNHAQVRIHLRPCLDDAGFVVAKRMNTNDLDYMDRKILGEVYHSDKIAKI